VDWSGGRAHLSGVNAHARREHYFVCALYRGLMRNKKIADPFSNRFTYRARSNGSKEQETERERTRSEERRTRGLGKRQSERQLQRSEWFSQLSTSVPRETKRYYKTRIPRCRMGCFNICPRQGGFRYNRVHARMRLANLA